MAKGGGKMDGENMEFRESAVKDSGWAWMVCAALFCMLLLSLGYVRIFGILFVAFQSEFSSSASLTASIMGVYAVVYSITSLLACNVFLERFSARQITLLGGIIVAAGVALDVFAYSIDFLMCTNGVVVGIGNAMIYGPGIVILGMYFEKRRTFATAVAFSGASVGGILLPLLIRYILDEYGVRGAMLIFGAVLLNVVPAAMLLIPPKTAAISLEMPEQKQISVGDEILTSTNATGINYHLEKKDEKDEERRKMSRLSCSLSEMPLVIPRWKESANEDSNYHDVYENLTPPLFKSLPSDLHKQHLNEKAQNSSHHFNHGEDHDADFDSIDYKPTEKNELHRGQLIHKLKRSMDLSLFKNHLFYAFIGFHLFGYAGIVTFPSFVPPIAKENGISDVQGALLISLHAGIDLFCRILTGVIADIGWFERYRMLATAYIILGTVYQFVRFYTSFPLMILYVVMFGIFSGCFYSLHPSIAVDFFGKEKFAKVFGYVQFFHGVVITASYPIIGGLRDFTGTYAASCHFLGVSFYVAAVLLLIKPLLTSKEGHVSW